MKNHWLNNQGSMYVPLDYNDPSLDFFSAKCKIVQYMKARYDLTDDDLSSVAFQALMDNWAYCADLLALSRYREEKEQQ